MFNRILNKIADVERASANRKSNDGDSGGSGGSNSAEGFLCPTCYAKFPSQEQLENHYETVHADTIPVASPDGSYFACNICKMKLGSEIELQSHISRNHTEKGEVEKLQAQIHFLQEEKNYVQKELELTRNKLLREVQERARVETEKKETELKMAQLAEKSSKQTVLIDDMRAKNEVAESNLTLTKKRLAESELALAERPSADDVKVLQQEIVSVQRMMDQATMKCEEEKNNVEFLYDELKAYSGKLGKSNCELTRLNEIPPSQELIERLSAANAVLIEKISNQEKENQIDKKQIAKLQEIVPKYKDYDQICHQHRTALSTIETMKRHLNEKEREIDKLKYDFKSGKEELEKLKKDRLKLFAKIEDKEGSNAAIMQLKEENKSLQEQAIQEKATHRKEISVLKEKLEGLHLDNDKISFELQQTKDEKKRLAESLPNIKKNLENLSLKVNCITDDVKYQKNQNNAFEAEIRSEIENMIGQSDCETNYLHEAFEFIDYIQERLCRLIRGNGPIEPFKSENSYLNHYSVNLISVMKRIQVDLASKAECRKTLEEELAAKEESEKTLELELANANTQIIEKTEKICNLTEQLRQLETSVQEANIKLNNAVNEASDLETAKKLCLEKVQLATEKACADEGQIKELQLTIETLKGKEKDLNAKLLQNGHKIKELNVANQALKKEKKSVEDKFAILKIDADEKEQLNQSLQSTLEETSQKFDMFFEEKDKEVSTLKKEVTSLELQLKDLKSNYSRLLCEKKELRILFDEKKQDWEKTSTHSATQIEVLTGIAEILKKEKKAESQGRALAEAKLDEVCGIKLELEAKLENALEERKALLDRCLKSEAENEKLAQNNSDLRRKFEDSDAALHELGRENQTLQVEIMKHMGRKWADDAEVTHCTACGKAFSVTIRKHHCRNCGNIFCNECSAKCATVASSKKPVRVCELCYGELTK